MKELRNKIIINKATENDVEGIMEVLESAWFLQDKEWAKEVITKLFGMENYVLLVAKKGDIVAGFIDFFVVPSISEKWNEARILNFFVHKDFQGKGVGSKLLNAVTKMTDEMGVKELFVETTKENQKAVHFYKKHGFTNEYLLLERAK
ncbi:MAG: GNAT family N-acetyltransferase [Candidatus Bathyarchaeia archaeon]